MGENFLGIGVVADEVIPHSLRQWESDGEKAYYADMLASFLAPVGICLIQEYLVMLGCDLQRSIFWCVLGWTCFLQYHSFQKYFRRYSEGMV